MRKLVLRTSESEPAWELEVRPAFVELVAKRLGKPSEDVTDADLKRCFLDDLSRSKTVEIA